MIEVSLFADKENGHYEIKGDGVTQKEQFLLAGAFPRVEALIRNSPVLSGRILLKISGATVEIKLDSDPVSYEEIEILRARLLSTARQTWNQILAI